MNNDRGMKKWIPFYSLEEMRGSYKDAISNKNKIKRPILSDDQIEEINQQLSIINNNVAKIHYFDNGVINIITGLCKIYFEKQILIVNDIKIEFKDLLKIE